MALECAITEKALMVKKQLRIHSRRPACGNEVLQGALCLAINLLQHQGSRSIAWHGNPTLWPHVSQVVSVLAGRERPFWLRMLLTPA